MLVIGHGVPISRRDESRDGSRSVIVAHELPLKFNPKQYFPEKIQRSLGSALFEDEPVSAK